MNMSGCDVTSHKMFHLEARMHRFFHLADVDFSISISITFLVRQFFIILIPEEQMVSSSTAIGDGADEIRRNLVVTSRTSVSH